MYRYPFYCHVAIGYGSGPDAEPSLLPITRNRILHNKSDVIILTKVKYVLPFEKCRVARRRTRRTSQIMGVST
ncbi:hypothetical protein BHM03_00046519 [Ensete ventricosum]|nr:hypothetical protein BHM03_00046519 [Ensete ventricosum]